MSLEAVDVHYTVFGPYKGFIRTVSGEVFLEQGRPVLTWKAPFIYLEGSKVFVRVASPAANSTELPAFRASMVCPRPNQVAKTFHSGTFPTPEEATRHLFSEIAKFMYDSGF